MVFSVLFFGQNLDTDFGSAIKGIAGRFVGFSGVQSFRVVAKTSSLARTFFGTKSVNKPGLEHFQKCNFFIC